MTAPEPGGLLTLRRYVDAQLRTTTEKIEQLDENLAGYAGTLEKIERHVARLLAGEAATRPFHWPDLQREDPVAAGNLWAQLEEWVDGVLVDYKQINRELTLCWRSHPAALAVVTAAWLTWTATYRAERGTAWDAARWQRDVPAVAEELGAVLHPCQTRCANVA